MVIFAWGDTSMPRQSSWRSSNPNQGVNKPQFIHIEEQLKWISPDENTTINYTGSTRQSREKKLKTYRNRQVYFRIQNTRSVFMQHLHLFDGKQKSVFILPNVVPFALRRNSTAIDFQVLDAILLWIFKKKVVRSPVVSS